MTQEERDKRMAAAISIGLHVIVFGLLAAGGMFTFLQSHSQAPPVDVTVYNEASQDDTPAAGNGEPASNGGGGSGETYHMPQENMPTISESYTQEVQEQREIKKVMQMQGISEEKAKAVVAAQSDAEKPTADAVSGNHHPGDTTAGNTAAGDGPGDTEGPGNNPDAAPGLGTDANGNSQGGDSQGDRHSEGRRPATKAHLISQPDVNSYYPQDLRQKNITGTVTVHVVIAADGTVSSASVSGSSGYAAMDAAAVQIAYQCQYEPARNEQGEAVAAERNLSIPFVLQ